MRLEVVRASKIVEGRIATLVMEPRPRVRIVEAQRRDTLLEKIREEVRTREQENFHEADNDLTFKGRLCVPRDKGLRNEIVREAHETPYTVHLGSTKMYQDMKRQF